MQYILKYDLISLHELLLLLQVIESFGIVIVLSCVGSSAFKVVSCASAVAPSNIIPFAILYLNLIFVYFEAKVNVLIVGLVKVLLVNVCEACKLHNV